jgi:hypothetical protein
VEETMVLIVLPNGEKFALDVNPNATTLHELKIAIQQFNGMPVSNQRLFLSQSLGQNDSDLISNLGIGPFSTLTLHGADNTIGATSSTVKDELVKEVDSDSDSDSESESEYFIDPPEFQDMYDKIVKKRRPDDHLFEISRKRRAAKIEKQRSSIMFKIYEEKFCAEMKLSSEEDHKIFLEEDKKAREEQQKEAKAEQERKQAMKEPRKKVKRAKKAKEEEAEAKAKAKE